MRLTAAELAAHLRVSVRQVQRLVADGMPSIPTGLRGRVYDPTACEQWLAANLCPSARTKKAAGTSKSASAAAAYIDGCRQQQVRATPSSSKLNFAPPLRVISSQS